MNGNGYKEVEKEKCFKQNEKKNILKVPQQKWNNKVKEARGEKNAQRVKRN